MLNFFLALKKHGVSGDTDKELDVDLVDEYKMAIDDNNIEIVLQYKHCSHFFVELLMDYQHEQIPILIEVSLLRLCWLNFIDCYDLLRFNFICFYFRLQSITNFLNANAGDDILREYARLKTLKSRSETCLIQKLVGFIFQQYSMYPSECDVVLVCKAAIKMFGKIKGGIVRISVSLFIVLTWQNP